MVYGVSSANYSDPNEYRTDPYGMDMPDGSQRVFDAPVDDSLAQTE